ncbi:hypothetical protein ACFE04_013472 [Oxalis oulophora]
MGDDGKKKNVAIIGVSSLILVAMVVAVAVGGNNANSGEKTGSSSGSGGQVSTSTKMIKTICQPTDYKETCEESLTSANPNTSDPKELIRIGFQVTIKSINGAIKNSTTLNDAAQDPRSKSALDTCRNLMNDSIGELEKSFDKMGVFELSKIDEYVDDLKVWLSGSHTYQQTCLDAFENSTGDSGEKMQKILQTSIELTTNALAMVDGLSSIIQSLNIPNLSRRLLSYDDGTPSWVSTGQRKLLQIPNLQAATLKPNVIVAKDGSGKYKTINAALQEIPKKNPTTFVIYVKAGIYNEKVVFTKAMPNVVLIGQGPTNTKITGNLNFIDGTNTMNTATVVVQGVNFIAKDIGFENSAGAQKHQAVALRVAADKSIFLNCAMYGYQDTLYVHAQRQFYRDCTVYGTIDFIFGNGAVVMQNCKLIIRKPMENQACMVTAHGRLLKRDPTGLVIINSTVTGEPDYVAVKDTNKGYLGRPWKIYSRTLYVNSEIGNVITPEGWSPWEGDLGLNTLFYAEVNNRGPGAATGGRVKWKGIKHLTGDQALKYAAGTFIAGDLWIKPTGVPYSAGM